MLRCRLPSVAALVLAAAASACAFDTSEGEGTPSDDLGASQEGLTVCAKGATVKGLDVSHWQGSINFAKVKSAGYDFVIMKATEGTSYVDDTFKANWANAKKAGLIRGAYHFFRPKYDGVAQAKHFASAMGTLTDTDLPPVLDLEVQDGVSDATVTSRSKAFMSELAKLSGKTPMIYTGYFFTSLGSPSGFSGYPLWVANWGVSCPNIPSGGWKSWTFWQYTDKASVSGIGGAVDANRFNGTLQDLVAFAKGPDQKVSGAFESASCGALKGWAWDPDTAGTALNVSVYADGDATTGTLVSKVLADDKRSDLCTKLGSCNHGFSVALPEKFQDGKAHSLKAFAKGDAGSAVLLSGSPKSVTCAAPPPTGGTGGGGGAAGAETGGAAGADTGGAAGADTGGAGGAGGASAGSGGLALGGGAGHSGGGAGAPSESGGIDPVESSGCSTSPESRRAGLEWLALGVLAGAWVHRRRSA